jgi:hypothetical protein
LVSIQRFADPDPGGGGGQALVVMVVVALGEWLPAVS